MAKRINDREFIWKLTEKDFLEMEEMLGCRVTNVAKFISFIRPRMKEQSDLVLACIAEEALLEGNAGIIYEDNCQ